jgi:HK97 gp10 family phage protein
LATYEGWDQLREQWKALEKFGKNTKVAEQALKVAAEILAPEIEKRAPRDPNTKTGQHLAEHVIVSRVVDGTIYVGFHQDWYYGHMLEWGTVHQDAQPFAEPAFRAVEDKIIEAMMKVYRKELERVLA